MRFLSLSRPWPWAIFNLTDGPKTIENRSWPPPIELIDQRIALHAAKSKDENAFGFLIRLGIEDCPPRWDLHPEGVIVGVATIDRVVTVSKTLTPAQRRWFFETRADGKQNYGWVLTDVRRLVKPVAMRGAQGLRELPAFQNGLVENQLDRAVRIAA